MSEDLSSQLPKPPELQPLDPARTKIWQAASSIMMLSGVILMGWGGWFFVQQQLEISNPPARILEVTVSSVIEQVPTLKPTPTPLPSRPVQNKVGDQLNAEALPVSKGEAAAVQPSPLVSPAPTKMRTAGPTSTPEPDPSPTTLALVNLGTITPAPAATALPPPTAEPVTQSLADNPLVVVEAVPPDPASEGEAAPADASTSNILRIKRIVAESIELDSKVIEVGWRQVVQNGVTANLWNVADYAAGWHANSALPGQGGNVVLSGHHNIKGEVFRYIVDLEPGDIVTLHDAAGQTHDYVIVDKFIVKDKGEPEAIRRENAKWIGPFNEERLTLVTCWPYTTNTHRVIVIGKPAGSVQVPDQ